MGRYYTGPTGSTLDQREVGIGHIVAGDQGEAGIGHIVADGDTQREAGIGQSQYQ